MLTLKFKNFILLFSSFQIENFPKFSLTAVSHLKPAELAAFPRVLVNLALQIVGTLQYGSVAVHRSSANGYNST